MERGRLCAETWQTPWSSSGQQGLNHQWDRWISYAPWRLLRGKGKPGTFPAGIICPLDNRKKQLLSWFHLQNDPCVTQFLQMWLPWNKSGEVLICSLPCPQMGWLVQCFASHGSWSKSRGCLGYQQGWKPTFGISVLNYTCRAHEHLIFLILFHTKQANICLLLFLTLVVF